MIKSISFLSIPAFSKAILAAFAPMEAEVSGLPFSIHRRSFIPVLSCIHWSLVSINLERSSLVTMLSGTKCPNPDILEVYILILLYHSH